MQGKIGFHGGGPRLRSDVVGSDRQSDRTNSTALIGPSGCCVISPAGSSTKGFRRLKAHKQLPILKAALPAHQDKHATKQKLEENLQAA
jgi:hypothetical protein